MGWAQTAAPVVSEVRLGAESENNSASKVRGLTFGQSELTFEPSYGRDESASQFVAYRHGYVLRLEKSEASILIPSQRLSGAAGTPVQRKRDANVTLKFRGLDSDVSMAAEQVNSAKRSFFPNSDPKSWRTNIPSFNRVHYSHLYPGIDLTFYGHAGQLEYDLTVQPHADPSVIRLSSEGVDDVQVSRSGDLILTAGGSAVSMLKPVAYQLSPDGSSRIPVEASYTISSATSHGMDPAVVGFSLGEYDHGKPLIIDPVLIYGLDIPGTPGYSAPGYYYADTTITAMTADTAGNTYVAARVGDSYSSTSVMKFDPSGHLLLTATLGSQYTNISVRAIAVGAGGDIYVAGSAGSGLPTTPGAFQSSLPSSSEYVSGFLVVIKSDASSLIYSSYLRGSASTATYIDGLAVDTSGNAYVTGDTGGQEFPTTKGVYQPSLSSQNQQYAGFVAKFNPLLSGTASLIYSTYLAATGASAGFSHGQGIAVDNSGDAYVIENAAPGFPITKGAYNFAGVDASGVFVTKLNPTASALLYSAYIGPGYPQAIALDGSGDVFLAGSPNASDYPVTSGAYETKYGGGFVTELNAAGSGLVYSTYLSGPSGYTLTTVNPTSLAILPGCVSACAAYVSGYTDTTDFPVIDSIQSFPGPAGVIAAVEPGYTSTLQTGFLVALAPTGKSAMYSTYLGAASSGSETSFISTDSAGNVYYASNIFGSDAPTTEPTVVNPGYGYLAKIGPAKAGATVAVPAQLVFVNNQPVNSTGTQGGAVELRNMGSNSVTLKRPFAFSSDEFSETDNCPAVMQAGTACSISASFTPAATGARAGTLSIGSSSLNSPTVVSLEGDAINGSYLSLSTSSLTFADQTVNSKSAAQLLTVKNSGNQAQPLSAFLSDLPDFGVTTTCGTLLAAGSSCQIGVVFAPTEIGLRTAYLSFQAQGAYSNSSLGFVEMQGTGVLSAAGTGTLLLTPTSLNFGSVVLGEGAPGQYLTLINSGSVPITVNSIAAATSTGQQGDFMLSEPSSPYANLESICGYKYGYPTSAVYVFPFTLKPQSSCGLYLAFQPSVSRPEAGAVVITDSAAGSPHSLPFSGIGIESVQQLTISPSTTTFAPQTVGDSSAAQTFIITNPGEEFVTIDRIFTSGDFGLVETGGTCGGIKLAPLESCTVSVIFNPTALGSRTGTLTVTDALSSKAMIFNLAGKGIEFTGAISVGQSSIAFGTQDIGTTSAVRVLDVGNPGNSPLTISGIDATGDFAVVSQSEYGFTLCSELLAPGTTCQVPVAYSPAIASGEESGTLTVHNSAGDIAVALSGTAASSPQALHFSPSSFSFGSAEIGSANQYPYDTVTIYVDNTGGEPVHFTSAPAVAGVAPSPASDFVLQDTDCYGYIPFRTGATVSAMPPGSGCSFSLTFNPSVASLEKATLKLTDSAGTQTIAVSGIGTAATPAVRLLPSSLSFDQTAVGVANPAVNYGAYIRFMNTLPLTISSVSITSGSADFSILAGASSCAGFSLPANSNCSESVIFHPAAVGYRIGVITFKDNSGKSYTAGLEGYADTPVNGASLTPQALILPSLPVQTTPTGYSGTYVSLNNTGNTPLTVGTVTGTNISATSDFPSIIDGYTGCSGVTLPPGGACSVGIGFAPIAVGTRNGSLVFPITYLDKSMASLTASFTGKGLAVVNSATLTPQTVVFPSSVPYSEQSNYPNSVQITLKNTGTSQLTIGTSGGTDLTNTIGRGGDFVNLYYGECTGEELEAGESCNFILAFAPLTSGAKTGTLTIPVKYANGTGGVITASLSGTGIPAAPELQLNPSGLQFNVEVVGTSDQTNIQSIGLFNTGNASAKITSITVSPGFTISQNECPQLLSTGNSCSVNVAFTPLASTTPGTVNGTLTVADNTPGSPHKVTLSGTAIAVAKQLTLSQSSVSFGSQTVSTVSAPQAVYLVDLGSYDPLGTNQLSSVQINGIKLSGTNAADFTESQTCGGSLGFAMQGRAVCIISVSFAPGAGSVGMRLASVVITPAKGSALTIQLVGVGVKATPTAHVEPSSLSFEQRPVNSASTPQTVSITNTGTAPLTISEVSTTMPSEFGVTSDACSRHTIAPGKTCLVLVSFRPAKPGPISARLRITDDAATFEQTANLTGTGARLAQVIDFRYSVTKRQWLPSKRLFPNLAIALSATATSGLPVTYSLVSGKATLKENVLTPEGMDPIVVVATQSGDEKFSEALPVKHVF